MEVLLQKKLEKNKMDEYVNKLDAIRKLGIDINQKDRQLIIDNLYCANQNSKQKNYDKNE